MAKPYNGHKSWNAWNVALWIGNEEPLYRAALDCKRRTSNATAAARLFSREVISFGSRTPDGARYNLSCVRDAIAGLE
jgi:hypothetical protein